MTERAHFVLDPTEVYPQPEGWYVIDSEVRWLREARWQGGRFWIKGGFLCDWTLQWLKVWDMETAIDEIKVSPRERLCQLLSVQTVPAALTEPEILDLVTKISVFPDHERAARFLAQETQCESVWLGSPSLSHLAEWLMVEVAERYQFIEQIWQTRMIDASEDHLKGFYHVQDKLSLLRKWIGLENETSIGLGKFPLEIPAFLAKEFDDLWMERIIKSEGRVFDTLRPNEQPGMKRLGEVARKIFLDNPSWISRERLNALSGHLDESVWQELARRISPQEPEPLPRNASVAEALEWATAKYLPYRAWEVRYGHSRDKSIQLASSFEEWIISQYPLLKTDAVDASPLNYSVSSLVRNLSADAPVLWIVVDGLGWLDHLKLLTILSEKSSLKLIQALIPKISILPTKTEYAKWSLYAELLPASEHWKADAGAGFNFVSGAKRYTDGQLNTLNRDISSAQTRVYCWDTTKLDELYHDGPEWENLQAVGIPTVLEGIVKQIEYLVDRHPQSSSLKVLVCADHGQVIGSPRRGGEVTSEVNGRIGQGAINDNRFLNLSSGKFGIPHNIFVARGDAFYTTAKNGRGIAEATHGGLLPEEVVVGVSVLQKAIIRLPVIVTCMGEGTVSRPGTLRIKIRNPNPTPLQDVTIYLDQVDDMRVGQSMNIVVNANSDVQIDLHIERTPAPQLKADSQEPSNTIGLSGRITFRFSGVEPGEAEISSLDSVFKVNQIFQSGGIDIDEFL